MQKAIRLKIQKKIQKLHNQLLKQIKTVKTKKHKKISINIMMKIHVK